MPAPHLPTSPDDLRLPLRDLLRGARRTLSLPEQALKPALGALPAPVGQFLHRLSGMVPGFDPGAAPASRADLDLVARGLSGGKSRDISRAFARVLAHGMARVLPRDDDGSLLVSETLAAITFGDLAAHESPAAAAAALWAALDAGHVIGVAPGTAIGTAPGDRARIDTGLHALFLWLLCERPDDPAEEDDILALCAGLAGATATERAAALTDPAALPAMLEWQAGLV